MERPCQVWILCPRALQPLVNHIIPLPQFVCQQSFLKAAGFDLPPVKVQQGHFVASHTWRIETQNGNLMEINLERFKKKHFLQHAEVRDFTLFHVAELSEDACFWKFVEFRWGGIDQVVCPACGVIHRPFARLQRKQLRCRHCDHHFSPLVDSPFADRKMKFKKLLMSISLYVGSPKGVPALHLSRLLNMQDKTATVLTGKLRESLLRQLDTEVLSGVIEIDGGHFCGKPRKANRRVKAKPEEVAASVVAKLRREPVPERKPRSKAEVRNWLRRRELRRIVMVVREIHPEKGNGAVRTRVVVAMAESQKVAVKIAEMMIQPKSLIMTDENAAYKPLAAFYDHQFVEHAFEFSNPDGVNENQAECYFSRMRRAEYGTFHGYSPKYLIDYAQEFAWREDLRRHTEREKMQDLFDRIFKNGKSVWWRGYWQGHHRQGEFGVLPG